MKVLAWVKGNKPRFTEQCLKKFFFHLFIWLCGVFMQDLQLQSVGSSSLIRDQTQGPVYWELGVSATGPQWKFPEQNFQTWTYLVLLIHQEKFLVQLFFFFSIFLF